MIQITDTIYLIPGHNNGRFPYCHCLYIKDEICALIDTAAGDEALKPLLYRVDIIVNSHYHPDHIRGNGLFPLSRILCHAEDKEAVEVASQTLRHTGYSQFTQEQREDVWRLVDFRPSRVDGTFRDGEVLDFGRTKLRVIHTPGHTPGHCCFYEENRGILFGADIDLTVFGPWYGHQSSDPDAFEASIEKLASLPIAYFVSGHEDGHAVNDVKKRLKAYAGVIRERDRLILEMLPATLDELVGKKLIYPRFPQPEFLFYFFEQQMIGKHLKRLESRGLAEFADGKWQATKAG